MSNIKLYPPHIHHYIIYYNVVFKMGGMVAVFILRLVQVWNQVSVQGDWRIAI